jgi:hypothetical protein
MSQTCYYCGADVKEDEGIKNEYGDLFCSEDCVTSYEEAEAELDEEDEVDAEIEEDA